MIVPAIRFQLYEHFVILVTSHFDDELEWAIKILGRADDVTFVFFRLQKQLHLSEKVEICMFRDNIEVDPIVSTVDFTHDILSEFVFSKLGPILEQYLEEIVGVVVSIPWSLD